MNVDVIKGRVRQVESLERAACGIHMSQMPETMLRIGTDYVVGRRKPVEFLSTRPLRCAEFGLHGAERHRLPVFQPIQVPPAGMI